MSSSYSNETSQVSCSNCKLEIWENLLLKWLNKCVHPKYPVSKLNKHSLGEILKKYKHDILDKAIAKEFLNSEEKVEKLICLKYPLLKFPHVTESKEQYKKNYVLTTILLYHCCINSVDGRVGHDICAHLNRREQETILRFCEKQANMDITVGNIEAAIRYASLAEKSHKEESWQKERTKPLIIYSEESSSIFDPNRGKIKSLTASRVPSPVTSFPVVFSDNHCLCPNEATILVKTCPLYNNRDTQIDLKSTSNLTKQTSTCSNVGDLLGSCCIKGCACTNCSPKKPCCGDPGGSLSICFGKSKGNLKDETSPCCIRGCTCSKCSPKKPDCEDPPDSVKSCFENYTTKKNEKKERKEKKIDNFRVLKYISVLMLLLLLIAAAVVGILFSLMPDLIPDIFGNTDNTLRLRISPESDRVYYPNVYQCKNSVCQKIYRPTNKTVYLSLSRCSLLCMGPQIWPFPIGFTFFSKNIVAVSTSNMEYKIQSVPSEAVYSYLAEAFKLFVGDLAKLEKMHVEDKAENHSKDLFIKKLSIQLDVETDADPRIRINTDETYNIKIELIKGILTIKITSASFCGARHGLETLSQLILLDQTTGYLITLSNVIIRDAPSYKYRGLMIDTGRNYIPVPDLIRTIDAMATCKLNTFHWRITDVTSFPLYIPTLPQLFENGAYDRESVYTRDDIRAIVKRAGIRGIRVLIEIAAPGPVGRAWSWSSDASCPTKTANFTCSNVLCLRLTMRETVMDILQILYTEIIDLTKVDDIFHLSDSIFSLVNCHYLLDEREGFLDAALERLKRANRGVLPKMPIIWYTNHLAKDYEAQNWDRLGVQLSEWQPNPSDQFLNRYRVIHSSRWDLSCDIKKQRCRKYKTWQEMYSWRSWRNLEVFSIEGGEALLWTDLVDTGNLDYHLWPRAAAVAERLWSDIAVNGSAAPSVYVRLDSHRWRMLLKSIKVQPIWPMYCTFNPDKCIRQIRSTK